MSIKDWIKILSKYPPETIVAKSFGDGASEIDCVPHLCKCVEDTRSGLLVPSKSGQNYLLINGKMEGSYNG